MTSVGETAGTRPSKLGRYELITQIGQGGMAEVQLALQRGPAGFEKLVVVKLVHDKLAAEKTFVDMLLEEARMAAMLKHPNVVDIYDLGQADGRYFIAMEYLEGEPLLSVLRAGREGKRLDPLSTGRLIADAAEGLDAAHELRTMAGDPIELVHHDVSLGNIVVLYNGQVKLVDFGVAKATQTAGPTVKVQGKFSYMAPEKLRGNPGDRRSDIFSLGVVAWEAMTLRRLFKGGNDGETMKQVLETNIAPPSSVNGDVPKDFDAIIMRALERDPSKRYATAKELAQDLEDVLREHKYGGKNDLIAKYMQATFQQHITARKKLLQEVSSKGGASADVLEAAFNEPMLASGAPSTMNSGEFSVRFTRPSREMAAAQPPPDDASGVRRVNEQSVSQVLTPLPRAPRTSGQILAQPWEPEVVMPGGGTTANTGDPKTRLYVIGGVVAFVIVAIVIYVVFSGGPEVKDPGQPTTKPIVAPSTTPPSPPTTPPPTTNAGSGATPPNAAGSANPGAGSGSGTTAAAAGSGADAGSADPGAGSGSGEGSSDDAPHIEMPATGGGSTRHGGGGGGGSKPSKADANEMFQTGMRAYVGGDVRGAIGSFRKAVQAQPGYAAAWRALGLAHEKLGEWGQAKTALQRYLTLAPNAGDAPQIRQRLQNL